MSARSYVILPICGRCGHPADWHRHDDVNDDHSPADPDCPFRCLGWDVDAPGSPPPGGRACDCPNYDPVTSIPDEVDEVGS